MEKRRRAQQQKQEQEQEQEQQRSRWCSLRRKGSRVRVLDRCHHHTRMGLMPTHSPSFVHGARQCPSGTAASRSGTTGRSPWRRPPCVRSTLSALAELVYGGIADDFPVPFIQLANEQGVRRRAGRQGQRQGRAVQVGRGLGRAERAGQVRVLCVVHAMIWSIHERMTASCMHIRVDPFILTSPSFVHFKHRAAQGTAGRRRPPKRVPVDGGGM